MIMNWTTANIFRILGIVTLFLLFLAFLYKITGVLGYVAAAFLITILLSPLVDFFQKYMPKKNRGLSVFVTFILTVALLILIGFIVFPPLLKELTAMVASLADTATALKNNEQVNTAIVEVSGQKVNLNQLSVINTVKDVANFLSNGLKNLVAGFSKGFFVFITVTTLTFFMLLDTKNMIKGVAAYVPKKYGALFQKLNNDLFTIVSKYFSGVIIVAAIAGTASFVPLFLLKAPYAMALALTIAIFDLIPMIGATIGSIIVIAVCLLAGQIPVAIFMTIYLIIYQQLENNVIIPLVQKQTVKMSPLAILVALLIGGAIGGIIGTLLAIPAAAFIKIVYTDLKDGAHLVSTD
jgi:predicted PurR-regulated permease PerM